MRIPLLTLPPIVAALLLAAPAPAQQAAPPKGFIALFNGKDLAGWHGMPHYDPRKLWAMKKEDRDTLISQWTQDAEKHWRAENGELVNDGHGAYLTTDNEFGDVEL